jgi:hypothetical protein
MNKLLNLLEELSLYAILIAGFIVGLAIACYLHDGLPF